MCSEYCTGGAGTGEFEAAVMSFGNPFGNGEAEARAGFRMRTSAGLIAAKKSFEDTRLQLWRNAGAIV